MSDAMRNSDVHDARPVGRTASTDVGPALLAVGGNLLARDGLSGLTVRALAAASGVAPSGVYSRFGGMEGLIDALRVRGFVDLATACDRRDLADPHQRLWAGVVAYRQWTLANPRLYQVMFMVQPGHGVPAVAAALRGLFRVLVGHVEYAKVAGILAATCPTETAQQVLSAAHGALSLELSDLVMTEDPETAYFETVRMVLRGLAAPPARCAVS